MIVGHPARIRYYAEGTLQFESPADPATPSGPRVSWLEPEGRHSVENTGQHRYHAIRIELKESTMTSPTPAAGTSSTQQADPRITSKIIREGLYELVRAPGHAESHAWHVLVGGKRAGLVRHTWLGERSRPGWQAVDNAGTALPETGIGRTTAGGNARTRDAAAVSLLHALQRQQQTGRRRS